MRGVMSKKAKRKKKEKKSRSRKKSGWKFQIKISKKTENFWNLRSHSVCDANKIQFITKLFSLRYRHRDLMWGIIITWMEIMHTLCDTSYPGTGIWDYDNNRAVSYTFSHSIFYECMFLDSFSLFGCAYRALIKCDRVLHTFLVCEQLFIFQISTYEEQKCSIWWRNFAFPKR